MKHLFLHIGLGKTGSSALQSWLSLNAEKLSTQGIDYADLTPEAKHGEVLSGNGYLLHRAFVNKDFDEAEKLITSVYFFNPENNVSIVSCELFQGINPIFIKKIREICETNDINITVIAYVRSVYEQLYSTYIQGVKRSSVDHCFGEDIADISFSTTVKYLKRYLEEFGDAFIVVNYDEAKKDIYSSFAELTGIDTSGLEKLAVTINRSLTLEEAEVLRRMNKLHKGAFSTKISDFIIGLSSDVKTSVMYDEVLVHGVRKVTEEDMRWVNEQFKLTRPLVSDYYDGHVNSGSVLPDRTAYQPVLKWALEYEPSEDQQADFELFLKDLAVFLVEFSGDDSISLIRRAYEVQQTIAARAKELMEKAREQELIDNAREPETTSDDHIPEPAIPKPQYVVTYHYDNNSSNTDDAAQLSSKFADWLALFAPHRVGSTLNPIENTRILTSPDSVAVEGKASMSGFTIVEADDMDTILAIVRKCPLLDLGASVEVSHIVRLY